jgi:transcriptional regulator with XRE-family HTH domain
MANSLTEFGTELRRRRLAAGVSLAGLAAQVHYSKGYLSKIETGCQSANHAVAQQCDTVLGAGGALVALVPEDPRRQRRSACNGATSGPVPAQLPHDLPGFAGRDAELAQLEYFLEQDAQSGVISTIDGAAGIGKTALAIRFGHRVADRFPDGQLYLNLRGFDPCRSPMTTIAALGHLIRGVTADPGAGDWEELADLDDLAALFRSLIAGKRMLVVLDNAATADQVRPLLPGSPTCFVVVTSRDRLGGLVARHGARRVTLRPLAPHVAVALVSGIVGLARIAAEPESAVMLTRLCDGLPLALCVAAERVAARPHSTLAELTYQLAVQQDRLDALATNGDEAGSLRTVFSWSYCALPPDAQRMFRLLGLNPTLDICASAAAALADIDVSEARRLLGTLVGMHLLEEPVHDRYECHDLLHVYATERAGIEDTATDHRDALRRLLSWYQHSIKTYCDYGMELSPSLRFWHATSA